MQPKVIDRDYKRFDKAKFCDDVDNFAFDHFDGSNFKETIYDIFVNFALIKRKYLRANEAPFMINELIAFRNY